MSVAQLIVKPVSISFSLSPSVLSACCRNDGLLVVLPYILFLSVARQVNPMYFLPSCIGSTNLSSSCYRLHFVVLFYARPSVFAVSFQSQMCHQDIQPRMQWQDTNLRPLEHESSSVYTRIWCSYFNKTQLYADAFISAFVSPILFQDK